MPGGNPDEYEYPNADVRWDDNYVWTAVKRIVQEVAAPNTPVFELGCGNGITARRLHDLGLRVTAVDPSTSGIRAASAAHYGVEFHVATAEQALAERFGRFPLVVSLEVIEHCYSPKRFMDCVFELLEPGGLLILSTPYHGYLKNLALAITGKMDAHFSALWEGGHIKFFSESTITKLIDGAGFSSPRIMRTGRISPLAKSMLVTARKPNAG